MNLKRMLSALLVVAIMLCVSGLALAENAKISFVDDSGRTIELEKPLERVAVFNKMNVEIVRALGKIDTVVGIDANVAQDTAYWPELDLTAIAG